MNPVPAHDGKIRDWLEVPGTDIRLPYTDVRGRRDGPTLLVTGGVHGGEYTGIESAIRFAESLDHHRIRGRVMVVHLTNPPAFFAKRQYVSPLDEKNLNRVFPGDAQGTPTERVASTIVSLLPEVDYWVDLHGGDIHESLVPFTLYSDRGGESVVSEAQAMARAYGISHILESSSIAGGTYATAAELGIPAILTESGQMGQLDEASVEIHLDGLTRLMMHLGMTEGTMEKPVDSPILHHFHWLNSPKRGLVYRQARVGDEVSEGQVLAVVKDVFGEVLGEVRAPQSGVLLFMVTSLAINAGDPVCAVAAP